MDSDLLDRLLTTLVFYVIIAAMDIVSFACLEKFIADNRGLVDESTQNTSEGSKAGKEDHLEHDLEQSELEKGRKFKRQILEQIDKLIELLQDPQFSSIYQVMSEEEEDLADTKNLIIAGLVAAYVQLIKDHKTFRQLEHQIKTAISNIIDPLQILELELPRQDMEGGDNTADAASERLYFEEWSKFEEIQTNLLKILEEFALFNTSI
jgi:hypothetical protein